MSPGSFAHARLDAVAGSHSHFHFFFLTNGNSGKLFKVMQVVPACMSRKKGCLSATLAHRGDAYCVTNQSGLPAERRAEDEFPILRKW